MVKPKKAWLIYQLYMILWFFILQVAYILKLKGACTNVGNSWVRVEGFL
jgi:hypothetical protein